MSVDNVIKARLFSRDEEAGFLLLQWLSKTGVSMSRVIEGVEPAATPAAPEASPAQEHESFADYMKTWTPEQRESWDKTGKEPEAPTAATKPVTVVEPTPEKAKVEPPVGGGEEDQDQEPEWTGSPEQQAKQRHAFAKMARQRAEARAEAKVLREQLAAQKPAGAAPAPKAEPKSEVPTSRPRRPRLDDAKYQVENGGALYDADLDEHEVKLDAYLDAKLAERLDSERQRIGSVTEESSRLQNWHSEMDGIKSAHGDNAVKSIESLVVSLPMMGVLMRMKGGAQAYHYFAQNPDAAKALLAETDIAGDFKSYEQLADAADKDPKLSRQLGAAEALVRAEAKRILSGSTKTPDPKPITVSGAPPPPARVDSSSSGPAKDALAEAHRMYDETGEHKYLTLINKLEDERDAERRRSRKR